MLSDALGRWRRPPGSRPPEWRGARQGQRGGSGPHGCKVTRLPCQLSERAQTSMGGTENRPRGDLPVHQTHKEPRRHSCSQSARQCRGNRERKDGPEATARRLGQQWGGWGRDAGGGRCRGQGRKQRQEETGLVWEHAMQHTGDVP